MGHVIHNTIKLYCTSEVSRARYLDWLIKNNCKIVGAGMGERSLYVLVDSDTYLPLLDKWLKMTSKSKELENI